MLVGRKLVVLGGQGGDDLAVLADDIGHALDEGMVDIDLVHVLGAFARGRDGQVIGLGDLGIGVGGDGKLAGAELGVGRELLQPAQIVGRDTDDGGLGGREFVSLFGKGVGFQVAAAGIG